MPSLRARFGDFELDLRAGELRGGGDSIILSDQPFVILRMLVEREGETVTREEFRRELWPNDTVVEFDHSINAAINKLRRALGDSADEPRYIGTVARRGYRLMVPVEWLPVAAEESSSGDVSGVSGGAAVRQRKQTTSLLGSKVSHYRVLKVIGGGGMGLVYKAEDLKLGRAVALKFLPEDMAWDPVSLQRFEREARTASSLDHPNICTIFEVEEHEGQPFIVMQLLEGETLRDRLTIAGVEKTPLPLERVLDIMLQLCDGLQAAHDKNIIHRDIKPANIFLTAAWVVKILDFGLAKPSAGPQKASDFSQRSPFAPSGALLDDQTLTRAGHAMGTAGYMSPEQMRGERLDGRTDLFSAGLVLYEMATGQRAFTGESSDEVQMAILTQEPVPPRELNPGVPAGLEQVIGKALHKDRNSRYASAAEMRADLMRIAQPPAKPPESADRPAAQEGRPADVPLPAHRRRWLRDIVIAVIAIAIGVGVSTLKLWNRSKLTEKDSVVLAAFENHTGDPIFDDTLNQALAVDLGQSPFVNLLPEREVSSTLRLMGRPPLTALTMDAAKEVCIRSDSKALIGGTISSLGNSFVIGLRAVACNSGDTLAQEQVEAKNKEAVLQALHKASSRLRSKLGESLASVQKYDVPLEQATTPSLEALKAYSVGLSTKLAKGDHAALPFFQLAVELDPKFAMAYARGLGITYNNLNQPGLSAENFARAFELRGSTSVKEKLYIEAHYYSGVTGELIRAKEANLMMRQIYPRESSSYLALQSIYTALGDYEHALEEVRGAISLSPKNWSFASGTPLIVANVNLNRFREAEQALQQAQAHGVKPQATLPYLLAFFDGNETEMERQVAAARQTPAEPELLKLQSDTEAYFGRLSRARELGQAAREAAMRAGATDTAELWRVDAALQEAELGDPKRAEQHALEAIANSQKTSFVAQVQGALALARSGDSARAVSTAEQLARQFPSNTMLNQYWLPAVRAAAALSKKDPEGAIDALRVAAPYELGSPASVVAVLYPVYLRGLAYLAAGQPQQAAAEFQKVLDHRGIISNFPTASLTLLYLGRAQAQGGDYKAARQSYETLLARWKNADPDLAALKAAKAEYAALP